MRVEVRTVLFGVQYKEPEDYRSLPTPEIKVLVNKCPRSDAVSLPKREFTGNEYLDEATQFPKELSVFTEQVHTYDTRSIEADEPVLVVLCLGLASNTDTGDWYSLSTAATELTEAEEQFLYDAYAQLKSTVDDNLFYLLPEKFTLTQAHGIYDSITGYPLKPPHFRRRIADKVKETDEFTQRAGHRPAKLYTKGV